MGIPRNMNNNFFKQEKSEEDINIIISSLRKARIKYKDKTLVTSKNDLIYKIVDNLTVTRDIALKYLMIIQSRGIITIDRDVICFSPKENEEVKKEAEKEVEDIVNQEVNNDSKIFS